MIISEINNFTFKIICLKNHPTGNRISGPEFSSFGSQALGHSTFLQKQRDLTQKDYYSGTRTTPGIITRKAAAREQGGESVWYAEIDKAASILPPSFSSQNFRDIIYPPTP